MNTYWVSTNIVIILSALQNNIHCPHSCLVMRLSGQWEAKLSGGE